MQIEVVDDSIHDVGIDAIVREFAGDRVNYFKKMNRKNIGDSWNTCLQRSRGHLVHLLHDDDHVAPTFYSRMAAIANNHPDASMVACRSFFIDEHGFIFGQTPRLLREDAVSHDPGDFLYHTPIQCAGVVVRRSFYEEFGAFAEDFSFVLDMEMWVRAIVHGGLAVSNEVLSSFRMSSASTTSLLSRNGANIWDIDRLAECFAQYPRFEPRRLRANAARMALMQAGQNLRAHDLNCFRQNIGAWLKLSPVSLLPWMVAEVLLKSASRQCTKILRNPY